GDDGDPAWHRGGKGRWHRWNLTARNGGGKRDGEPRELWSARHVTCPIVPVPQHNHASTVQPRFLRHGSPSIFSVVTSPSADGPAIAWRDRALARLQRDTFDLLVIGGGITGAGIARDAALRGLAVALVERDDFASGTSSRSSRLVHGG